MRKTTHVELVDDHGRKVRITVSSLWEDLHRDVAEVVLDMVEHGSATYSFKTLTLSDLEEEES